MTALRIFAASLRRRAGGAAMLASGLALNALTIAVFLAAGLSPASAALASRPSILNFFIASAVVAGLFSFGFGWFVSGYFLAGRKREIATWLMAGMRRRTAALILSAELAAASAAAYAAGMALAFVFSRFFGILLGFLMGERNSIALPIAGAPAAAAAAVLAAQACIASVRGAVAVRRSSLAALFSDERLPGADGRPRPGRAAAGAALILLAYAATFAGDVLTAVKAMLPALALTVAGTFLLYDSLVPAWLARLRAGPAGRDPCMLAALAQASFRARRNARVLALSSVLVATAVAGFGSMVSLSRGMALASGIVAPHDLELAAFAPGDADSAAARVGTLLSAAGAAAPRHSRIRTLRLLAEGGRLGSASVPVVALPRSDWEAARRAAGRDAEGPKPGEAWAAGFLSLRVGSRGSALELRSGGGRATVLARPYREGNALSDLHVSEELVLDDAVWESLAAAEPGGTRVVHAWDARDPAALNGLAEPIRTSLGEAPASAGKGPALLSKEEYLRKVAGEEGGLLFIGGFLAAAFLAAAASTLAFKLLEDARDDVGRYRQLRAVGMTSKDLGRTAGLQVGFSFLLPLCVGSSHACFALNLMGRIFPGFEIVGPALLACGCAVAVFAAAAAVLAGRFAAAAGVDARRASG